MFNQAAPLPPQPDAIEHILKALDELGEKLDDELNGIWEVLTTRRRWWHRWEMPERDELVAKAQRQRLMFERIQQVAHGQLS